MVDFGEPFISLNGIYNSAFGKCSALTILAHMCGYEWATVDVVEKAIILLNRKADISCREASGDTVLHTLLKCQRLHGSISKPPACWPGKLYAWRLSFKAPKDLLMVFITAGADVYATNDYGETPSMVASSYGRADEWIEALQLCGYDSEEVLTYCMHCSIREHQNSKLFFQEYCQQRYQPGLWEQVESESIDDDSEDDDENEYEEVPSEDSDDSQYGGGDTYEEGGHEETSILVDKTACVVDGEGSRNTEIFGRVEKAEYDMNIGLDIEGKKHTYNMEELFDHPVSEIGDIVDNDIEGKDINIDDWLDNGIDIMQSFTYSGMFIDPRFE